MRITVVGEDLVATQLAAKAARIGRDVREATMEAGRGIEADWEATIPKRTGQTASDPMNVTVPVGGAGTAGARVESRFFVARFLQTGTVHMSPKVDLFGLAEPHIDRWTSGLRDVAADL